MTPETKIEIIYTACTGEVIPLDNIDFVGKLETGELWDDNYIVALKSGNKLRISKGRNHSVLKTCRDSLIEKLKKFIENKT